MLLYPCHLEFHDNLFYETRTMGRLYETGRLLHNIALCYAIGLAETTFYHAVDAPRYADELRSLNEAGVYVTPARGDDIRYVIHTFKLGEEHSSVLMERSNANIPSYGRAKEIDVGSRFSFAVLAEQALSFPKWVRMGLWLSKARLTVDDPIRLDQVEGIREEILSWYPTNPADLPESAEVILFDLVSMRPTSLLENALIRTNSWWRGTLADGSRVWLPRGLRHRVGN